MTFVGITDGGIFQSIFRRPNRAGSKPRVVVVEKEQPRNDDSFFRPRRKKTRGKETLTIRFSWPPLDQKRFNKKALRNYYWGAKKDATFLRKKKVEDGKEEGAQI